MEITAIVPCFNEKKRVLKILAVLCAHPKLRRVIVVDDGSTDGTRLLLKRFIHPKLKKVFLPTNQGKGRAIATGLRFVKTKAVFLCDADLVGLTSSHLDQLFAEFERWQGKAVVVALVDKPFSRLTLPLRKTVLPLISGTRIFPTHVLWRIIAHPLSACWGLEPYANWWLRQHGIPLKKIFWPKVYNPPKPTKGHGWKPLLAEIWTLVFAYFKIYFYYLPRAIWQRFRPYQPARKNHFYHLKIYVDKTRLHCVISRTKKAKADLVFIHGWANNWEGWLPVAQRLQKRYNLYLVDLPGFGDSAALKSYSIVKAGELVAQLINQLKLKKPVLIGISMGSLVASWAGVVGKKNIKKIILVSPIFRSGVTRLSLQFLRHTLRLINHKKPAEEVLKKLIETRLAAYLLAKYINMHKFNRFLVDMYGLAGKRKIRKEAFVQMGISAGFFNLEKTLAKLKTPVLLILGEKDKIIRPQVVAKIVEGLPSVKMVTLPEAGHVVAWEQDKAVAKLIDEFVSKKQN